MSYSSTSKDAGEQVERAGDYAADAAKVASRKASEAIEQVGDLAQDKVEAMAAYVRRNPLQATAIAAGVGFVFALLARR